MWFLILLACHIAIASAWKILLYDERGSDISFTSSSLNVIPYPVYPISFFEPSVKIVVTFVYNINIVKTRFYIGILGIWWEFD